MRRSIWYQLLLVAVVGWSIAALATWLLVARTGWLGILMIGLIVLMTSVRAELDADSPAFSLHLARRQYEETFEQEAEDRMVRWAARVERTRLLYIARTFGIAMALLGLNMFIRHQL